MKRKEKQGFDPKTFLARAAKGRTLLKYQKNGKVFLQGDGADSIFYIQRGKVKLTVVSRQGKEAVVTLLGAGDFFGEGCLAGQHQRMTSATALSDCSFTRLEKAGAMRLIQEQPAFSGLFLHHLLSQHSD